MNTLINKLTEEQIQDCINLYMNGKWSQLELARKYKVPTFTITMLISDYVDGRIVHNPKSEEPEYKEAQVKFDEQVQKYIHDYQTIWTIEDCKGKTKKEINNYLKRIK